MSYLVKHQLKLVKLTVFIIFVISFSFPTFAQEDKANDEIANTNIRISLGVDYNRDGIIEFPTSEAPFKPTVDSTNSLEPYVFWLNDDDDEHDSETSGNDVPGTKSSFFGFDWRGEYNYENDKIDGSRDLIDFFPIAINFHGFFSLVPDASDYKVRLKHEDEAINIVYTEILASQSDNFLRYINVNDLASTFGDWQAANKIANVTTYKVTSDGLELKSDFLEFSKKTQNKNTGILLAEARAVSTKPLILEIENAEGHVVLTAQLPLKFVNVEDMYAQVNIRELDVKDSETASDIDTTEFSSGLTDQQDFIKTNNNVPASFKPNKNFVFLHGYRVDKQGARAWHAETFKRLYHSGSNAMYVGFSWNANEGVWPTNGELNYWGNVENAFNTAPIVSDIIQTALSGDITVAAHSLGNMVLSQAIQYEGFTPDNYFMLNPAVPVEAYDSGQLAQDENGVDGRNNPMIIPNWEMYYHAERVVQERRLFASDWHSLFDNTDNRSKLTWKDLFKNVPQKTNVLQFYSKGEDVLAKSDGTEYTTLNIVTDGIGANAWVIQEHQKGKNTAAALWSGEQGGWGFNCAADDWYVPGFLCTKYDSFDSATAFAIADQDLQERPFFNPFLRDNLFSTEGTEGSDEAALFKGHTLAFGIPALSHAAGVEKLGIGAIAPERTFDMNEDSFKKEWPAERRGEKNWLHSDAKNIAYRYVYNLYDIWVQKGGLK